MQTNSKFSLAAALFGWPAAPGHTAPDGQVPDAWVLLFREQHATPDPAVLNGLFCSCRSGRDWVLDEAREVTLTLDTTTSLPSSAWLGRIATLRQSLSARGSKPVALLVRCDTTPHSAASVAAVGSLVYGLDTAFTELTVRDAVENNSTPPLGPIAGVLHSVAPCLSAHLTTLSLDPCPTPIPPPSILPQLCSLSVTVAGPGHGPDVSMPASIMHSIAPYLAQLHTLEIQEHSMLDWHGPSPWPSLTPLTPSHTLTSLSISSSLTDAVLSLVITHMPALERLDVWGVELGQDYSVMEWGVRELTVGGDDQEFLTSAYLLPRCREGGHMTLSMETLRLVAWTEQGLDDELLARLPEWRFACDRVWLHADMDLEAHHHPAALRNTLRQMSTTTWHATETSVCGKNSVLYSFLWKWTPDMLRHYAEAIPALKELGLARHEPEMGVLTDDLLSACIEAGPHLWRLGVDKLCLQSDKHANTPWPWERLMIGAINDLGQLLRLPNPAGQGSPRDVNCGINAAFVLQDTLPTVDTHKLRQWFKHAPDLLTRFSIRLACPADATKQASTLRQQLSFLTAITPDNVPERGGRVCIEARPLTHDTLDALSSLPEALGGFVSLSSCTWPLAPTEYARLAQCIPPTYTMWSLGDVSSEIVQSVCEGINARKKGEVTLVMRAHRGQEKRMGEYVVLGW